MFSNFPLKCVLKYLNRARLNSFKKYAPRINVNTNRIHIKIKHLKHVKISDFERKTQRSTNKRSELHPRGLTNHALQNYLSNSEISLKAASNLNPSQQPALAAMWLGQTF